MSRLQQEVLQNHIDLLLKFRAWQQKVRQLLLQIILWFFAIFREEDWVWFRIFSNHRLHRETLQRRFPPAWFPKKKHQLYVNHISFFHLREISFVEVKRRHPKCITGNNLVWKIEFVGKSSHLTTHQRHSIYLCKLFCCTQFQDVGPFVLTKLPSSWFLEWSREVHQESWEKCLRGGWTRERWDSRVWQDSEWTWDGVASSSDFMLRWIPYLCRGHVWRSHRWDNLDRMFYTF